MMTYCVDYEAICRVPTTRSLRSIALPQSCHACPHLYCKSIQGIIISSLNIRTPNCLSKVCCSSYFEGCCRFHKAYCVFLDSDSAKGSEADWLFLTSISVLNIASSLMKLHHKYVMGRVAACHMAWASKIPHRGGKSKISKSIAKAAPNTTPQSLKRAGCLEINPHVDHIKSWVTPITTQTIIFNPVV